MKQLTPILRGYKTFFCFVQVKVVIFPNVPKSTLRSWMKDIHVSCVPAYPEERDYLKLVIPNLHGAFGLLEENDLTKLLRLKARKELRTKERFSLHPAPWTSTPAKDAKNVSLVAEYSDSSTSEDESFMQPFKKRRFSSFTGNEENADLLHNDSPKHSVGLQQSSSSSHAIASHCESRKLTSPLAKGIEGTAADLLHNDSPKHSVGLQQSSYSSHTIASHCESGQLTTVTSPLVKGNEGSAADLLHNDSPKHSVGLQQSSSSSHTIASHCESGQLTSPLGNEESAADLLHNDSPKHSVGLQQSSSSSHAIASHCESRQLTSPLDAKDTSPVSAVGTRYENTLSSKRRSSYRLDDSDMSPELKAEVKQLIQFYTRPLNPNRDGVPLATSTLEKMEERCRCFLYYVRYMHKSAKQLTLSLCNDTNLVLEYITYLKDNRKLKPSTLSRIISVLISIVKYNYGGSSVDHSTLPEIIFLRRLQSQLERENRVLSQKSKEGISKQARSFYHAHILDALKSLRCKFEESSGPQQVRHLHDFLIISLFVTVMPGRSKELRTLQIHDEGRQGEFDKQSAYGKNFINFAVNGSITVFQTDYKTANKYGAAILTIDRDEMLAYYLKLYLKKRLSLLLGKSHNYFFMSYKGEPFSSSGPFSKYVSDMFEREVSIRAGTTALRHAILTYFNSLDESRDESLRESLAALMKHSVRYQKTVYDDRSHEEKTKLGRKFMQENISNSVFSEEHQSIDEDEAKFVDCDDNPSVEIPIRVNDICCLLDPISTPNDIRIFVAKVARFSADRSEVYLMHLEKRSDSNNLYAFRPGDVWKESCKSLVYPVDIVYNSSENAYELRTTKQAIYKSVHGDGL